MSNKVIVHLKGGGSYETTEIGLPNAQRLLAGKITGVERDGDTKMDLTDAVDENLVIEITETQTLKELEGMDKDVLRKMANDISERKSIAKANGRSGVESLAKWIFANQSK